jgi:Zn-dependent peptidase ImmA (M78 family)/DNA-binding XRE family transcriptional regulator
MTPIAAIQAEEKANPQMIILARESRGLNQKELADALGISTGKLCRVELEDQTLTEDVLAKLSGVLKYPQSFFYQKGEGYIMNTINFRKLDKVSAKVLSQIEAQTNIFRMNLEILLERTKFPAPKLPDLIVMQTGSPEESAKRLRKLWKLPKGPVENLTELIEGRDIPILSMDFGTGRVDSRAVILNDWMHVAIVINKAMLGDRQRFSLAFHLGHLVMHSGKAVPIEARIDHEAKVFAAEFLMPEEDIRKDFEGNITLQLLAMLKKKWKCSMQAIMYRASDLGFLTTNQNRYLISQFNALKIRRREPPELDVEKEKSTLIRDLITRYRSAQKMSVKEMATLLNLLPEDFSEKYK